MNHQKDKVVPMRYHRLNYNYYSCVTFNYYDKNHDSLSESKNILTEPIKIDYVQKETTIRMQRSLYPLQSIFIDLFIWITEFRETSTICEWEEEISLTVSRSLLSTELLILTKPKRTIDSTLDEILRFKYPKQDSFYYHDKYRKLRQKNYYLISDYYKEITEIVKILAIKEQMNDKDQSKNIEEIFFLGLDNECRSKFMKMEYLKWRELLKE
ncbi:hypothetical protein H311_00375 [Anncaliia algerae PRA109]|nr:hypothetical protein H311_00375 [Anncaliia algerae PRA109]